MIGGIGGWELIALAIIAVVVLGPERMPEYAAKLARAIRKARVMAEGAKGQLKEQLGPEYDDVNWRQYDPRQYDPRRIVREAFSEPFEDAWNTAWTPDSQTDDVVEMDPATPKRALAADSRSQNLGVWQTDLPTPYDDEAT